ncbi:MAG: DMT family transporter [Bryobacterales bacterium]|nr:DMT family transporter [Bryobacterales bacterium]
MPQPLGLTSVLLAIAVSVLWGGNVVSIRIGVDSVPPLWSAFWRMALGVVFVAGWARSRGVAILPVPGEWGPLFCLGVLFTTQIALLNTASELTSPAYGVVILNSYPVFVNLTGHIVAVRAPGPSLEDRLSGTRILGLGLAMAGVAMLAFGQPVSKLAPKPVLGNLMMVSSAALLGVRQVYTRYLVQTVDPVRAVVWQMAWSVPLFLVIAAMSEPMVHGEVTWQAVAAISYQGIIVAGICFIVWAELLKKHSAGMLSMFAFLVPVCGVALSGWIFAEPLRATLLIGGVLAMAGVWVVTRER